MFDFIFLISAIIFVTLDYFYLNLMKGYFEKQIQSVQGSPLKMNLGFLLFGEGNIPFLVKELLRDAQPDEALRPRVIIG